MSNFNENEVKNEIESEIENKIESEIEHETIGDNANVENQVEQSQIEANAEEEDIDLEEVVSEEEENEDETSTNEDSTGGIIKSKEERQQAYLQRLEERRAAQKIEFGKHRELFTSKVKEAGLDVKVVEAIQDFVEYLVSSALLDVKDDVRYLKRVSKARPAPAFAARRPFTPRPRDDYEPRRSSAPRYEERGERPRYNDDRRSDRPRYEERGERSENRGYQSRDNRSEGGSEGYRGGGDRRSSSSYDSGSSYRGNRSEGRDDRTTRTSTFTPNTMSEGFKRSPR